MTRFNVKETPRTSLSIYLCTGKLIGLQELSVVCSVPESHNSVFSGRPGTIIKRRDYNSQGQGAILVTSSINASSEDGRMRAEMRIA